jgi:hypothetical protein
MAGAARAAETRDANSKLAKAPTTDTIAAELTVPERVLLYCLSSDTN